MFIPSIIKKTLPLWMVIAFTLQAGAADKNARVQGHREKTAITSQPDQNYVARSFRLLSANNAVESKRPRYNPAYQEHIYTREERTYQPIEKQRPLSRKAVIVRNKNNATTPSNKRDDRSQPAPNTNAIHDRIQQYYFFTPTPFPKHERKWRNYCYFGGSPYPYGYGVNNWVYDEYLEDAYEFGFLPGFDIAQFYRESTERGEKVRKHAHGHHKRGLKHFRKAEYRLAARDFKLAAETNQGDPTTRIYAAHALFAVGRYEEAVQHLRRAFDLQPKIAMLSYDLRKDYQDRRDFDQQFEKLKKAHQLDPDRIERLVLMGYIYFYTDQREKAYQPLFDALKIDPDDALAKLLLENCELSDVMRDKIKAMN